MEITLKKRAYARFFLTIIFTNCEEAIIWISESNKKKGEKMMNIGDLLRIHRLNKGWTQKQVAQKIGVEHNTYSQYETGKRHVDASMFLTLAQLLDIKQFNQEVLMSLLDTKVSLSIGIKLKEMTIDELRDLKRGSIFDLNGKNQDSFPLLAGNESKSVIGYGIFQKTEEQYPHHYFKLTNLLKDSIPYRTNNESMLIEMDIEKQLSIQEINQLTLEDTFRCYDLKDHFALKIWLGKEKLHHIGFAQQLVNTDDLKIRITTIKNPERNEWLW